MTQPDGAAVVDGVDIDAVAAAVRACPGIDDLADDGLVGVSTYLPGRKVPGLRVSADHITVQVRCRWGVRVPEVGAAVRSAVRPLVGSRVIDVAVLDIAEPP